LKKIKEMSQIPKILVVDDDPDIVEILRYNLSMAGYDVKSAINGKEGIKKAKIFIPQIILLDVMMPEMDGIQACSLIKEIPALIDTRIVFLSARVKIILKFRHLMQVQMITLPNL
jgi:two-component system alkaline phosphatase synthesis response regulator PhoP